MATGMVVTTRDLLGEKGVEETNKAFRKVEDVGLAQMRFFDMFFFWYSSYIILVHSNQRPQVGT